MTEIYSLLATIAVFVIIVFVSKWLIPKVHEIHGRFLSLEDVCESVTKKGGLEDRIGNQAAKIETLERRSLEVNVDKSQGKMHVDGNLQGDFVQGNQTKTDV